MHISWR